MEKNIMIFKVNILESNSEISKKILTSLLPEIQKLFKKITPQIQKSIKELVINAIKGSPEYSSLISGSLRSELGVPDIDNRLNSLFNIWFNNIKIDIKPPNITGSIIKSSLSISLIKSDLSEVLDSPSSYVIDNISGSKVDWLEWLSLAGDKTIIKDYDIRFGSNPRSRTGNAIMVVKPKSKWKVPSEFSGTLNNNWITRSIENIEGFIESEISNIVRNAI